MKHLSLTFLILLVGLSLQAVEIYLTEDRIDKFACTISASIKKAYPNKTRRQLRKGILKLLRREINPWVDAYPIPAGLSLPRFIEKITGMPGFPMDRSEYYLQNAFILYGNPEMELNEPIESYFGSFIHLARKRHIDYLNNEAPKFQLREEPNLLQQIENNLHAVADLAFPYKDKEGNPIQQTGPVKKEKDRFKLAIGEPDHKKYDEFVRESQMYNHFSSPLFVWLLKQDDFSVSPEELFAKSLEIYGDPIVALGVIPWVFSGDALTVDRGTSSVVSYKVERMVEGYDVPGLQYHFWGYLTQGFVGGRFRVRSLAYLYEYIWQYDLPDWKIDILALHLAAKVRESHARPYLCESGSGAFKPQSIIIEK